MQAVQAEAGVHRWSNCNVRLFLLMKVIRDSDYAETARDKSWDGQEPDGKGTPANLLRPFAAALRWSVFRSCSTMRKYACGSFEWVMFDRMIMTYRCDSILIVWQDPLSIYNVWCMFIL